MAEQVDWALQQIEHKSRELLEEAEHGEAAQMLDPAMVHRAVEAIRSHLDKEGDLRSQAIAENLIAAEGWRLGVAHPPALASERDFIQPC